MLGDEGDGTETLWPGTVIEIEMRIVCVMVPS